MYDAIIKTKGESVVSLDQAIPEDMEGMKTQLAHYIDDRVLELGERVEKVHAGQLGKLC